MSKLSNATIKLSDHEVPTYNVLNAVRNSSDSAYQSKVPVANADNIAQTLAEIGSSQQVFNKFYGVLSQIAMINVIGNRWNDPISKAFRKDPVELGTTVEDIFVDFIGEHLYSLDDADQVWKVEKPKMVSVFNSINRASKYKVTLTEQQARQIFIKNGIGALLQKIQGRLEDSAERDATLYSKQALTTALEKNKVIYVEVGDVDTDATARENFLITAKTYFQNFQWLDNDAPMNVLGVDNPANPEDIITMLSSNISAQLDVSTFAGAFNLDKAILMGQQLKINNFHDSNIVGIMMDKNFLQIRSLLNETADIINPEILARTFYKHVWEMYALVPFYNAVVFVKHLPDYFDSYLTMVPRSSDQFLLPLTQANDVTLKSLYPAQLSSMVAKESTNGLQITVNEQLPDASTKGTSFEVLVDGVSLGKGEVGGTVKKLIPKESYGKDIEIKLSQDKNSGAVSYSGSLNVNLAVGKVTTDAILDKDVQASWTSQLSLVYNGISIF